MGVGTVFPSPTKKQAIRITKEQLKEICSSAAIPAVAIGGITFENVDELNGGGIGHCGRISSFCSRKHTKSCVPIETENDGNGGKIRQ